MSLRGIKFAFEPGEYVLCFEPDLTKARVLYEAKIQEQSVSRDGKGRKRPEYHIHFQGWNSSWDRVVPESFIVKDNLENRTLMRRLANIARQFKSNKSRLRKIDNVLKQHFGHRLRFDSDSSDGSDESESEESTDEDDDDDGEDETDKGKRKTWEDEDEEIQIRSTNGVQNGFICEDAGDALIDLEEEMEDLENKENELRGSERSQEEWESSETPVELEIPRNLKHKLEDDCYYITRKDKLVILPANPNIITILEGYVKNFSVNVLCATAEKQRPNLRDSNSDSKAPEKNIEMCKEVMDGLRVYFDFALPNILLYNAEQSQYQMYVVDHTVPIRQKHHIKQEPVEHLGSDKEEEIESALHSPRLRSAGRLNSPRSPSHGVMEPFPKCARMSPRRKDLEEEEEEEENVAEEEGVPSRRMTRRALAVEVVGSGGKHSSGSEAEGGSQRQRRNSLRSHGSPTKHIKGSTAKADDPDKRGLSDRLSPPTPLHIPPAISTAASTEKSPGSLGEATREAAVNDIFSWRMLPEHEQQKHNTPSMVYGAHHLLRLFVRLPGLLSEMHIPEAKLKSLTTHLQMFLEYLSNGCEELFRDSVYIDSSEQTKPLPSRHR